MLCKLRTLQCAANKNPCTLRFIRTLHRTHTHKPKAAHTLQSQSMVAYGEMENRMKNYRLVTDIASKIWERFGDVILVFLHFNFLFSFEQSTFQVVPISTLFLFCTRNIYNRVVFKKNLLILVLISRV